MNTLRQLFIIFAALFVGTLLKMVIPLPIPSTVYGMIVLFLLLLSKKLKPESITPVSNTLLDNLAFLFVPSGVALIEQVEKLKGSIPQILIAIVCSTAITVFVTGHVVQFIIKRKEKANI